MSGQDSDPPLPRRRPLQTWALAAAVVLGLAAMVPPLLTEARRYQFAAALQLALLAIVVPGLATVGAPWTRVRLAGGSGVRPGPADRLAEGRLRHRELIRSVGFIALDLAAVLAWMTPAAVGAVTRHAWLVPVETVCLVVLGIGMWLELVESTPLVPRSGLLRRAVLAAVVLWAFWTAAYVIGLSRSAWYANFHHAAGHGLSAAADQQVAVALLWLVAAVMLVPVVFWNALRWIRDEENPDVELYRLTRIERLTTPRSTPRSDGDVGSGP